MRKLMLAFATTALLVAAVAVTAQPKQQTKQGTKDERFEVTVTPEMERHTRILHTLYFAGTAYSIIVLLIVLAAGWSARLRDLAQRVTKRRFLAGMLFTAFLTLVTSVLGFPLELYGGYIVPHQFDLTNQSFASWMGDELKGLAIGLVIGSLLGGLAILGIRKMRRWWLVLWIGSIPVIILLVVIAPVFIDPIFNKFEPLKDQQLKQALLDEASRAGIEGSRVYQVNKSKQTKEMNAYVTGLGPTRRIVMWDTLLDKMTHDEILAVMGHEMGHYVMLHLWKGLAFGVVTSFFVFFFGQMFYDRGLARWGARWHIAPERGDPAALPWLLVGVSIIGFLLSPVQSGFSRHLEHQSDKFGLELTHFNEPMASAFVKFAKDSKLDPAPSPFIEFWLYSHPSLARRIDFVLHYKPWEQGQPNELWKAK
ncbi:MAG: M48 family metallopeptidase [Thermoanaerobaculia bacterium]